MLELFEPLKGEPSLRLVSLMDHTPGQRQWRDLDKLRSFHLGREVKTEAEFQAMVARRVREQQEFAHRHRAEVLRLLEGHAAVRASHDDTTPEHVAEARACGCTIAEFPTTVEAAEAARAAGMGIVMGAPNLVIGGSHSGNVAAAELVEHGPAGRLLLRLRAGEPAAGGLPAARRLRPADAGGDRPGDPQRRQRCWASPTGPHRPGLRADLVRVREIGTTPTVVAVWREGRRIG